MSFANDMVQRVTEIGVGAALSGPPVDDHFGGGSTIRDNFALRAGPSVINSLHGQWPSAKMMLIGNNLADANTLIPVDTKAQLEQGLDNAVTYYDFRPSVGSDSWGVYVDLEDLAGTTGIPTTIDALHLTEAQHEDARAALQGEFDGLTP